METPLSGNNKVLKSDIRQLIRNVNKLLGTEKGKSFPHITLVGVFKTNNERKLIKDFNRTCSNFPIMHFSIDGFGTFKDTGVVFLNILPDDNLRKFRWVLANQLKKYCQMSKYDYDGYNGFNFHSTIAMRLNNKEIADTIKIVNKFNYDYKYTMVRITLLKNGKIHREYNFFLRESLSRKKALYRSISTHNLDSSEQKEKNKYSALKKYIRRIIAWWVNTS
jgi:hypothetical protein